MVDKIKKGNTLQTAAFQPHGGIVLYRDILANVLDRSTSSEVGLTLTLESAAGDTHNDLPSTDKVTESALSTQTNEKKILIMWRIIRLVNTAMRAFLRDESRS